MHATKLPSFQPASAVVVGLALLATHASRAQEPLVPAKPEGCLRIATLNASLNRGAAGQLTRDLTHGDAQAEAIAATIRAVRPDILLLNEIDYSDVEDNAALFASRYLEADAPDVLG